MEEIYKVLVVYEIRPGEIYQNLIFSFDGVDGARIFNNAALASEQAVEVIRLWERKPVR